MNFEREKRSEILSTRIGHDFLARLALESKRRGMTTSSLSHEILLRYAKSEGWTPHNGEASIAEVAPTFQNAEDSLTNEKLGRTVIQPIGDAS